MPKRSKFVGEEGEYLIVHEGETGGWVLAWFFPEDDAVCVGGILGDMGEWAFTARPKEDQVADVQTYLAFQAAKPLADPETPWGQALRFVSRKKAQEALRAANTALVEGDIWPSWALEAKAAGWTPPAGWKPST